MLAARLYPHASIRLTLALLIAAGALFARYALRVEDLPLAALLWLAAAVAAYNLAAALLTRQRGEPTAPELQRLTRTMELVVAVDYVALTIAIWLVGGARSPFVIFYVLHLALNCLLMPRRTAIGFGVLAYGLLGGMVLVEWLGILVPHVPEGVTAGTGPMDGRYALTLIVANGLLFALVAFLLLALSRWLHDEETRANAATAELARLSDVRRDFLHVALHNLQSPLGAVTMHLRNLQAGRGGPVSEPQADWLDRSLRRLEDMSAFLRDLRTLALLESGGPPAQEQPVDVDSMLRALIEQHADAARDAGLAFELAIDEALPAVVGIEPLLREAVANYVTNAIKYTPEGGRIEIRARNLPPRVRIEVTDTGIGIADADRERVFADFVRIEGERPAAGSGLGLGIVRRIAAHHGGTVGVDSVPGRGSTFFIELPAVEGAAGPDAEPA